MQKLKFSKDEGNLFYKELRTKVDSYFKDNKIEKYGNNTMLFKIILYFTLVVGFYISTILSSNLTIFYTSYLLMGFFVLLNAFNVSHDAVHGVAVKNSKLNKFLFQLSFQLQGNNAYTWGKNHNESHHLFTNVENSDIDVLNSPLVRMTDTQPLRKYHKFQFIYAPFLYLFYSINWFFFRDLMLIFNYSSRTIDIKMPGVEVAKIVFFKLFYIAYMIVLPAIVLPYGTGHILLAFLLNHFVVSIIFTAVLGVSHMSDFVQHPKANGDKLDMSWAKLQILTSVDYNSNSKFCSWTLGGFNAHAVHHLLPDICHVHYLKLLPIFRETCEKHGFTYLEMPYKKAIASHFRFLKKMGSEQTITHSVYEN